MSPFIITKKNRKTKKNRNKKYLKLRGGKLPSGIPKPLIIPSVSPIEIMFKNKQIDNKQIDNKQIGGDLPTDYVNHQWGDLIITTITITDDDIAKFKRINIGRPFDCVISALQIIGILDFFSANIIRILNPHSQGGILFRKIEMIFELKTSHKFKFSETDNPTSFIDAIKKYLKNSSVIFCGVRYNNGLNHVFLIAKDKNGEILKIDPQSRQFICSLITDNSCLEELFTGAKTFLVLSNYTGYLTMEEAEAIGFI